MSIRASVHLGWVLLARSPPWTWPPLCSASRPTTLRTRAFRSCGRWWPFSSAGSGPTRRGATRQRRRPGAPRSRRGLHAGRRRERARTCSASVTASWPGQRRPVGCLGGHGSRSSCWPACSSSFPTAGRRAAGGVVGWTLSIGAGLLLAPSLLSYDLDEVWSASPIPHAPMRLRRSCRPAPLRVHRASHLDGRRGDLARRPVATRRTDAA
jgi:hypothetical protein